ncbi:MAG TPA: hypothetical protein VFV49_01660 [Thermoanaerobaculia bacterium]|nr:hypothetical protein [Thermoanaerobaculia bacterium]
MNVQHERNLHLRARLHGTPAAAQLEVPWRTNGIVAQCFFFVLACVALGAFYGLIHVLDVPRPGLVTGAAAIVLAEVLISRRWFFTGVEAALWIGGVFALISELPRSGTPESMLVLAAASAIAGARVRNPLFGALAAIFVMLYFERRFDVGVLFALFLAFGSCIALLRTWRRPTTEALWIALALVMPVAGRFTADAQWRTTTIMLYAMFGGVALLLAVTRRHHAHFLTAMIALAIAATDVAERIQAPPEAKLAIAGAVLLGIAFAISRALRDRTHGFVLTPIALTPIDDATELAATLTLQPAAPPPAEPAPAPGGGSFGGAGASGDYS